MNALLEQFLSEARDCLQGIGEKLMQLENAPADPELMTALFRMVHTLKGNSGLFEFPEMTRVLHAGEDLMDAVRNGRVNYSQELADRLLDAMDFVGLLCDEIEAAGSIGATHAANSARLAESLRQLIACVATATATADAESAASTGSPAVVTGARDSAPPLAEMPEAVRMEAHRLACAGATIHWIDYVPAEECFFQGDDPFFQARGTPEVLWQRITARQPWPPLAELDAYRCVLNFQLLTAAPRAALDEHYRYMPDQVRMVAVPAPALAPPVGERHGGQPPVNLLSADEGAVMRALLAVQREILVLPIEHDWQLGRMKSVAATLAGLLAANGEVAALATLDAAAAAAVAGRSAAPLLVWLDAHCGEGVDAGTPAVTEEIAPSPPTVAVAHAATEPPILATAAREIPDAPGETRFGRRAEDSTAGAKSLKVDQAKIDRLMNLIGEMVVSKNALPYLAGRAETVFGSRELSREIKAQYTVINRIAEEMQDAIMQVRMLPVSFVFQRFPRLVRDTARKLDKEVTLLLEGEETEADKNIIESLGDPLVHIVRNSLDHGFELPAVRRAAGKPAAGTLTIRASQEADRVVIEISDDGKGIDPAVIKRKAYEKGLIDEATLDRISDQEAVNLVFAAGFSTAEVVSDLSGRGVGMDVVRTAVEKVNGTVVIESELGKGTRIRLSLPLSMAVSNVMIIESDGQTFGMPMDSVVETVRVPRSAIRTIKKSLATVLRGRIVPLKSINTLLGLAAAPKANADDELAVLVVRRGDESVGLLVDDFRETVDVILKPMMGVLAGLSAYAGSALMGDGSVLMVLNVKEIL
jgi:two-component system chemotaxis sensor kinase CheA